MGQDISGSMIVGAAADELCPPDDMDLYEYIETLGLDTMSPWYDSDTDCKTVGFLVSDVPVAMMDEVWLAMVKSLASQFEDLTGVEAELIGMQNVT